MSRYAIKLEISGPAAMWSGSDTGDASVSYPAPPYAAVKGIFESVLWLHQAEVVPTKVEICRPIKYQNYTTYGGPLSRSGSINESLPVQSSTTVLKNVCYRLYTNVEQNDATGNPEIKKFTRTTNSALAYKSIFERKLKRGQFLSMPYLGWKEFAPDYVGDFRPDVASVHDRINLSIPSSLYTCFSPVKISKFNPGHDIDIQIKKGVLHYVKLAV